MSDLPNLKGYTIIVTGGNSGIGYQTVLQLALAGARVYIAARSPQRITTAINRMQASAPSNKALDLRPLTLDLQSLHSVDEAAKSFMKLEPRLDILINNAGIMNTPFALTVDGFELQWQTNYLAPFLFTRSLLPLLEKTAAANAPSTTRVRVVNVSSDAAFMAPAPAALTFKDVNFADDHGTLAPWRRYAHSKLASLLHAHHLHTTHHPTCGLSAYSLHPGIVPTNLQSADPTWFGSFLRRAVGLRIIPGTVSVEKAAKVVLGCAVGGVRGGDGGGFFRGPGKRDGRAGKWIGEMGGGVGERLWGESERVVRGMGFS